MQEGTHVERFFSLINETADLIASELKYPYIEAVAETGENLFHGEIHEEGLSETTIKLLKKKYSSLNLNQFKAEELRKAFQLAILKGLKEAAHPNHQMTPDAVGLFLSYLVKKFLHKEKIRLLDPAVGTGNLLTTVLNDLEGIEVDSYGSDVDDLLLKLALVTANLQQHPVQFYNQDSLQPLYVDPVDITICDIPVGYYPNDEGAKNYQLKADEGHSFAHHLFIEQSINYTLPGGYLFFIIPNHLFESSQAPKLNAFLKENVYIQGLFQLPVSLFKGEQHAKSIFILQKKSENISPPKQALLVNLPKFSNKQAMQSVIAQIDEWIIQNKG
ncbi:class I SAM-dependent methyltransferase [Metabacillus arenae]|uniref:Class I SAM-dependent methyltransferase n=1 Tax=Metabacillus arenae TaxID=2771434 RepID=A0A926N9Q9_9BACI|nr:class I SAM-dependent methyltransferase [Metabacillus arenae]MBD1380122.1 class I SAM-dependent methyltransferase [Metabacillus arenae]